MRKRVGPVRAADRIATQCHSMPLRALQRAVTRIYDRALAEHGVTIGQVNLLAAMSGLEKAGLTPVRPADLGAKLLIEQSTISRDLARLERDGLVGRVRLDGRSHGYTLRPKAHTRLEGLLPAWKAAQREAKALLGPAEAALREALVRATD